MSIRVSSFPFSLLQVLTAVGPTGRRGPRAARSASTTAAGHAPTHPPPSEAATALDSTWRPETAPTAFAKVSDLDIFSVYAY
jgi:hypothetical protein